MKAAVHNLGCKTNAYESEAMQEALKAAGYEIISFNGDIPADIYVVNTCSVTNIADRKSRQMLHKARKLSPKAVIVAVGCFVQENAKEILEKEDVDICLGSNNKNMLITSIEEFLENKKPLIYVDDISKEASFEELEAINAPAHTRAYIKIQDGCNQFCTYCIIPYTRGRIRSRKLEDITNEAIRLSKQNVKEIVLTGINMSSYGLDFPNKKPAISDVINSLQKIDGLERIRLSSIDPQMITKDFLEEIKKCDKLCPHFHLSLQSGSDALLKRMNRGYTCEDFRNKAALLRSYYDNPSLTTDLIVGFPGESEEEFNDSMQFIKEIDFLDMHIFQFSPRQGTPAADMPNKVDARTSKLRSVLMITEANKMTSKHLNNMLDKEEEILLEDPFDKDGVKYFSGHTSRYHKVICIDNGKLKSGQKCKVHIESLDLANKALIATILDN